MEKTDLQERAKPTRDGVLNEWERGGVGKSVNLNAVIFYGLILTAGYCLGGQFGMGISAVIGLRMVNYLSRAVLHDIQK